jgi:hypothetical protein
MRLDAQPAEVETNAAISCKSGEPLMPRPVKLETAWLVAGRYSEEYRADLSSVLRGAFVTRDGPYFIGVVEGAVRNSLGTMPSLSLLQDAAQCTSLEEAISVAQEWIKNEVAAVREGGGSHL